MIDAALQLHAASRLHFGLLAWGDEAPRQFGSVGLMIGRPGMVISARLSAQWGAEGLHSGRVRAIVDQVASRITSEGRAISPLAVQIDSAPPEHVGLGTGTQLSLAVARLILEHAGECDPNAARLAELTGRGKRSGIGLHGALHGGLLVDGGRGVHTEYPPLLARHEFPDDWSILVVIPPSAPGLSDVREREAFARLPGISASRIDRLARLVLLGLLPAVAERDLDSFGASLSELQHEVGEAFAPAQGGIYADSRAEALVSHMRELGLVGVGQSSWGPALYGFLRNDEKQQAFVTSAILSEFGLSPSTLIWTRAANAGAQLIKGE